ncbi:hypothetical protein N7468_003170 [Penicillium chermesinum]|uniref:YCII-related domain-containing protein n=1 Tax=Penicillium chermesinum TaxID=63820 RepID=A0A9W9TRC8_9EURO|nr:uncharacterized protein N7468_003170 [Penicillium chermesinum]KAJ5238551.1 hypothetical protein N7468_003170 [Penicillium chermesinum]KAJ6164205.1 hypothetical protein N7470_002877 [Penicillium chermesinum]
MSSAPAMKEFVCILPDKPGAQAKRLEVRPSHLENAKALTAAGSIVAGGALLESHPAEGEAPVFKGSMMMVVAEDEAAVRALLEKDIYAREGVWDLEKAQVYPVFLSLLPPALEAQLRLQRGFVMDANGNGV